VCNLESTVNSTEHKTGKNPYLNDTGFSISGKVMQQFLKINKNAFWRH
jgi:hypothetical protein